MKHLALLPLRRLRERTVRKAFVLEYKQILSRKRRISTFSSCLWSLKKWLQEREDFKFPQKNRHLLCPMHVCHSSIPLTLVVSNPYSVNHDQYKNIHRELSSNTYFQTSEK